MYCSGVDSTGDEYGDGAETIIKTLDRQKIKASFFFTGKFYRNLAFRKTIARLKKNGHYLGAHSDQHLLYCDWNNRDSTLVTRKQFNSDLIQNYEMTRLFGIKKSESVYFLPPFEWYNDTIADWTNQLNLRLINFSPGTLSNADYTTPDMKNYRNSNEIYRSILKFEESSPSGLNGFILLLHIGTDLKRTDKFYLKLEKLVQALKNKGYAFETVKELLH